MSTHWGQVTASAGGNLIDTAQRQLVSAVIAHKMGRRGEAMRLLTAEEETEKKGIVVPALNRPNGLWQEWLIVQILKKEAQELITGETAIGVKP